MREVVIIVMKELTLCGSLGMQAPRFGAMMAMVGSGKLEPGRLVQETVGLEKVGAVLEAMDRFANVGVTVIDRH